ncbi:hypothetical protein ACFPRL_29425 [Pseudoclavibacter helvolus]
MVTERAGLLQHGVDEGGLAVVDVRHDGDVSEFRTVGDRHSSHSGVLSFEKRAVHPTSRRACLPTSADLTRFSQVWASTGRWSSGITVRIRAPLPRRAGSPPAVPRWRLRRRCRPRAPRS